MIDDEAKFSMDDVRRRLKMAREMKGWSQKELERRAKLPEASICHVENGRRGMSLGTFWKVMSALKVPSDRILGLYRD